MLVCCLARVVWLFGCLIVWLFGCLVVWLFGWLFGQLIGEGNWGRKINKSIT
jgi:hypothetical protein